MSSKNLYLLDPGHSGLIKGVYQTAGKRSPKFDDGSVLYEGVNNRDNVKRVMAALKAEGIDCVDIVKSNKDVPLEKRVADANALHKERPCVYISFHSDAAGYSYIDAACTILYDKLKHKHIDPRTYKFFHKEEWHPANGFSVYTSVGQTESDKFAEIVLNEVAARFGNKLRWRTDKTDGDGDKEENFYVLKNTDCPAILIEAGFHTNKAEAMAMLTDAWKIQYVNSIVSAIKKWEAL